MRRSFWIVLVALAMVAAACGSEESGSGDPDGGSSTSRATDSGDEPADGSGADAEPTDVDDEAADTDDPIVLTASWPGVTEDTILVGVAAIDAEALLAFDVDLGFIDPTKSYPAFAAAFNEAGGAHGRDVEVHVELFLPVGSVDSDRACSVLAGDIGVFVTVGQMLGDNSLCFPELNGIPYVGAFGLTNDRDHRADGQFYSYQSQVEPLRRDSVIALHDSGAFDGARVGLFWGEADRSLVDNLIRPLLSDLGVEVVSEGQLDDFAGDTPAAESAADLIFERFNADGADLLLNVSGLVPFNRTVERSGYSGQLVFVNGQITAENIIQDSGYDPAILVGAIAAAGAGQSLEEMIVDELWLDCVDVLNSSGEFDETLVPAEMDQATASSIRQACGTWKLMEAMLVAAGPDLTPDTLRAGAESLATIALPGLPAGTLGPDDHSAADAVRLFAYDPDEVIFLPDGEPLLIE